MSHEMLRGRLDQLRRSIREVESLVDMLEGSRKAVRDTKQAVATARLQAADLIGATSLGPLTDMVKELRQRQTDYDLGTVDRVLKLLDGLSIGLPALDATLAQASRDLDRLVHRYVPFGELKQRISSTTTNLQNQISALEKKFEADGTAPFELWREYSQEVLPVANVLFSEYIDLLGGVSIRDRGLSIGALEQVCRLDELCKMADLHASNELRQCIDWADAMFTVPSRDPAGHVPSWPVMRLGFAQWSIWGLPLEGHEFGKVVTGQPNGRLDKWKEELAAFDAYGLRLLVADVIGAWAEGPAYACALCLLSLDPRDGVGQEQQKVTAADRALLVELCLTNQIVAETPMLTPEAVDIGHGYLEFVQQVMTRWRTALHGTETARSTSELLLGLYERVRRDFRLQRPFGVDDWDRAKYAWKLLQSGQVIPVDPPVGIRHLLNAAWYARCSEQVDTANELIERLTLAAVPRDAREMRLTETGAEQVRTPAERRPWP